MARVVVVGAGVAGLAAAYRFREMAPEHEIVIVESTSRAGGLIRSECVDGFVIEHGPDSILTEKPAALNLVTRLGLQERIVRTRSEHRGAYVVTRGRLERVPEGFALLAPSAWLPLMRSPILSLLGKLRTALEVLLPRGKQTSDESLGSFVRRRLGPEMLERLAQPMAGGIYGTAPDVLSLRATMPRFLELERKHRSVALGLMRRSKKAPPAQAASGARYGLFISFDQGLEVLTRTLAESLGESLKLGVRVERLESRGDGSARRYRLALSDGQELDADALILAIPARGVAPLVDGIDSILANHLRAIPYGSAVTATFAWRREEIPHSMDASGLVVPTVETRATMAATWASRKWPGRAPEGMELIRVFLGGEGREEVVDWSDEELVAAALRDLRAWMGIEAAPRLVRVDRYRKAMPRYRVGHLRRAESIAERLRNLSGLQLCGGAYTGVGIPDSVRTGEAAAEAIAAELAAR